MLDYNTFFPTKASLHFDEAIFYSAFSNQVALGRTTVTGLRNYAARPVHPRQLFRGSLTHFIKDITPFKPNRLRSSTRQMRFEPGPQPGRDHPARPRQSSERARQPRSACAIQFQARQAVFQEVDGVFLPGSIHLAAPPDTGGRTPCRQAQKKRKTIID